jgi:hypothetical protein
MASLFGQAPAAESQLPTPHITEQQYRKHVEFLASDKLEGRKVDSRGLVLAAEYIVGHLKKASIQPASAKGYLQAFLWKGNWGDVRNTIAASNPVAADNNKLLTVRNLIGILPGKGELADQAVIVCAHYDHVGRKTADQNDQSDTICNGADDNASGVAVLLMLATQVAADIEQLPKSHRTIVFAAFDAEERGLVGARYYVKNPIWPLDKTAIVLNYDMVGRSKGKSLMCMDASSCPSFMPVIDALARRYGMLADTRLSGAGRSDNAPFLDKQIPGIHFNSGIHVDYHQVTDEANRLHYPEATRVARWSYHLLREAIARKESFEYQRPNPQFDVQLLLQIAAKLGIVPNQGAQNGKYPEILFVVPGSAAAKAGIKGGDQVVAINGARIRQIIDAMALFGQVNLRANLKLTMLRQRKEVDVLVPKSVFATILGPLPEKLANGKYKVVFRYRSAQKPTSVHLAGSFNDWNKTSLPMTDPDDSGAFLREMILDEGVYEYKFVVNDNQWISDPANAARIGQNRNSVLWVGDQ